MVITEEIKQIIERALEEDIGSGDVTSRAIIPPDTQLSGNLIAKMQGVVAGLEIVGEVFAQVDEKIIYTPLRGDGTAVTKGDIIARVEGRGPSILTAERVALNFLQRMSGIATATRIFVEAVSGTKAKILDTRKTAPGLRVLDKLAVKLGSGHNHRFGLYDMVLIKDNHIRAAGSIAEAVRRVREKTKNIAIEVEVATLAQLDEALPLEVDRIMLDNMGVDEMAEAVRRTAGRVELEASGNISLENIREVAATGVDFISVGALTHSVKGLDISLEITASPKE